VSSARTISPHSGTLVLTAVAWVRLTRGASLAIMRLLL